MSKQATLDKLNKVYALLQEAQTLLTEADEWRIEQGMDPDLGDGLVLDSALEDVREIIDRVEQM